MEYSTQSLLERLLEQHGPQEFGRVCQALLELTFLENDFRTVGRYVERPDLRIKNDQEEWIMEVRVPAGPDVKITEEDLEGLNREGAFPIKAAFVTLLMGVKPRWIIADATGLKPIAYNKVALEIHAVPHLTDYVNRQFPSTLSKHFEVALKRGTEGLRKTIKQRNSIKEAPNYRVE